MRLRIQHIFIQANNIRLRKHQIKILQCLCEPEGLHAILFRRVRNCAVIQTGMRNVCDGVLDDVIEHCPCLFGVDWVAGYAVEDEY